VVSEPTDLLLSSGFLAFARHAGFLAAVEDAELRVDGVVGTSSGALVGALWASGMPAAEIVELVAATRPWDLVGLHGAVWRGVLTLAPLRSWLAGRLPERFEDLPRPFAVGVSARVGGLDAPFLLREGPLVEAVLASCAIPGLFASPLGGPHGPWRDGGAADRLMHAPWRDWRGDRPVIAHVVERSAGRDVELPADLPVVRTPRSGASFLDLGDVRAQAEEARAATRGALRGGTPRPMNPRA
jgi:predicted acylesterase/phospholipase RssA